VLSGKNILLCVTGSIAAYKSIDILRRLLEDGASVTVVMTDSACRFISPLTFKSLSGRPVYTDLFGNYMSHISLPKESHLFIIAPATANTINKLACGIADNLLTTIWLAYSGPAVIAPAMNWRMYENPTVKKSIKELTGLGVTFVGPEYGALACGEEGIGRMAEVEDIIEAAKSALTHKDLSEYNILVTAGPTREPLDPIRFISNRSSGKMGFAIARVALRRGANVTLISGPTSQHPPKGASFISVENALEMRDAILKNLHNLTAVIMAAAVTDFSPASPSRSKIKNPDDETLTITFKKMPDILEEIGRKKENRILIGFAAETGKDIKNAEGKLKSKNLDLIVLNDVTQEGAGFEVDTNIVTIITRYGEVADYPLMRKEDVANIILDKIAQMVAERKNR